MSLRSTLTQRLKDTWHGAPWYGDPSDKILGGIAAVDAARRIAPGAHTIWEIVAHMVAWTETVAARVRGAGAKSPERGDWPAITDTSDAAWQALLEELATARRDLLATINEAHEEDIQIHVRNHMPPFADTGISRAGTVSGLVEHDVYHLGQIALLKRALK
ncbi:MAG TPA: DinB family protein [Gemmatimonadaceae bacterium]|nr:DinB family protein [Gemmatimonadaceae bacterium]